MKQVNIYAAKTGLSRLVEKASKGESFIIAKAGIPLAKLGPIVEDKPKKIKYGLMKGKIKFAADFDDPLPDWLLDAFEGKSD
jgi:antitoxin (DNA-binding transcriptional repressor) of toxin-antitoxin stability system